MASDSGGGGGKSGGSGGSSGGGSGGSSGGGGGKSGGGGGSGGTEGLPVQRNTAMCPSFVGARVVRITRLNACGAPMFGRENVVTTRGIVTASFEPEVEEGDSLDTKNLNGELCVQASLPDSMSGLNVSLEFCQVDPAVFSVMNPNWKLVRNSRDDYSGDVTGFRIGSNVSDEFGFCLEMWPKTIGATGAACQEDEEPDPSDPINNHGYFLLPFVTAKAPDEWEMKGDEVATFTLKGRTKGGAGWDVGPYVVTRDEGRSPSPLLRPIEDGSGKGGFRHPVTQQIMRDPDHFHAEIVTVQPPEPQCGSQDLIKPKICFEQEGQTVRVTLLNADEVAPPDPMTGMRPPVWVSWGDGTNRTNLTAQENLSKELPGGCRDDEEEPPPDDSEGGDDGGQDPTPPDDGPRPQVDVTQDERDPRKVTVAGQNLREPLSVDWGANVREPNGNREPQVDVQQDQQNPRRVTVAGQNLDEPLAIDWGQDVQPPQQGGGDPVQVQQDPNNPRAVTVGADPFPQGAERLSVDWGQDVQEQQS